VTALLAILAASKSQGNPLLSLLFLGLPIAAIFYLMVIPQRKQRAKQAAFLSKLSVGDEVVTTGGMYGPITYLEDGVAHLEVDTDVVIRVAVSSLSRAATTEDTSTADEDEDEDANAVGSRSEQAADKKKAK
jgi:preprotein translocase subunit YajC